MEKKFENIDFDIDQIEQERRGVFELVLIVIVLGLLLNIVASGIYDLFANLKKENVLFCFALIASLIVIGIFIRSLLREEVRKIVIPVVIFIDLDKQTISIPKEIHHPSKFRAPFTILCRWYFDKYQEVVGKVTIDELLSLDGKSSLIKDLIQFLAIDIYVKRSFLSWYPRQDFGVGPFIGSQQENRPGKAYQQKELVSKSNNEFLRHFKDNDPLILPPRTKLDFRESSFYRLYNPMFELRFKVLEAGGMPLDGWDITRGTFSTWYRDLSSSYPNTYALHYNLEIEFVLKRVFWRYIEENWMPRQIRPKISVRDILSWVNNWTSITKSFFEWVNEDISQIPASELAILVDDTRLAYKPKIGDSAEIIFHGNIIEVKRAHS